jgi:hypothetical protein
LIEVADDLIRWANELDGVDAGKSNGGSSLTAQGGEQP